MLKKRQLKFLVPVLFLNWLSLHVTLAAQQCCPDSHLEENKKLCADNETRVNIDCPNGAFLLDVNKEDEHFSLEGNETFLVYDGSKIGGGEFCLSSLWKNESTITSNLVALVCFPTLNNEGSTSVFIMTLILISILFLCITLYIYVVLPNLRDIRGKCVIAFICSLLSSYIILSAILIIPESGRAHCIFQGASMYFFMSSTFFWNNVITFDIWKSIRNVSYNLSSRTLFFIYALWGFGLPFLMLVISFALEHIPVGNHIRPRFGEVKCWFKGKQESWSYFYGPVSFLLILNVLMFLHCSWILWKNRADDRFSRNRSLRYKYIMYLRLFLLMGLTWVFEVLSYATNDYSQIRYLWYFTDCLNYAQGIFIFLILVVFRQKVRLGLLKKKLFGINWPKSWGDGEIVESETSNATEIELGVQKQKILDESQNNRLVD